MILYSRSGEALPVSQRTTQGYVHIRDKPCFRCGGAGGADKWAHTGWTCHRCGGKATDPNRERVKLYTPEKNAQLDATATKAAERRAVAKAEKDRLEQERRDAERAEIISANEGFIARIDAELAHSEIEVLVSIRDWIMVQAKEPSEKQVEAVNRIIERNTAERARLAGAQHVGQIKERRDFTLTLVYHQVRENTFIYGALNYWSLFTDENGCKIACKSAFSVLGLDRNRDRKDPDFSEIIKGQTVRVKATVVEHTHDKRGEPVTYINRPKAI